MGCSGCPLFPHPRRVAQEVATELASQEVPYDVFKDVIRDVFGDQLLSEISHRRHYIAKEIVARLYMVPANLQAKLEEDIRSTIMSSVRCYAAILHQRHGLHPDRPEKKSNKGYAPFFEKVTLFPGRMAESSKWNDLNGQTRSDAPWRDRLPRLIFVSDMGDALSEGVDFEYLKQEIIDVAASPLGRAHVYLWLTKQPVRMAQFSDWLAEQEISWPDNLIPMTSVLNQRMAVQAKHLLKIPAKARGLSVEPLWEDVQLDLTGFDWVIVGGESGSGAKPFDLAWARSLRDQCQEQGSAFFMKQLGLRPVENGIPIKLKDKHGGEWEEWPEDLRIREFPEQFLQVAELRPKKDLPASRTPKVNTADRLDFKRLHGIVNANVAAFVEVGLALAEIRQRDLWRVGGYASWYDYCVKVVGTSKVHANRLIRAAELAGHLHEVEPIGSGEIIQPRSESQIRPLLRLADPTQQRQAWLLAAERANGQPTAADVKEAVAEIQAPDGKKPEQKSPVAQFRLEKFAQLRELVAKRTSWEEVQKVITELEGLL